MPNKAKVIVKAKGRAKGSAAGCDGCAAYRHNANIASLISCGAVREVMQAIGLPDCLNGFIYTVKVKGATNEASAG